MFAFRVEKEGNISFTMYEHVKDKNRAEGVIFAIQVPKFAYVLLCMSLQ